MMADKVVDLQSRSARPLGPRAAEVWNCQISLRLSQIEQRIKRLEWQLWALFCGGLTIVAVAFIERVAAQ